MSLLDGGSEWLTVFVEQSGTDAYGNPLMEPSTVGVEVLGRVQEDRNVASAEDKSLGQNIRERYRIRLDRQSDIPYGPWSRVEWRGEDFEVLGVPVRHTGSFRTHHITAYIVRR